MKADQHDPERQEATLAGLLIISLFSMCVGIFPGTLVAS